MNNRKPTIFITGVTGFVGANIAAYFMERGYHVIGAARHKPDDARIEFRAISKLDRYTFWDEALKGADIVVHLAGRAHKMHETSEEKHLYYETNVEGTVNLAQNAIKAGVKKLIFISSIKAMLSDAHEEPLTESFVCKPAEPYGISKLKAEIELRKISETSGLPLVILRPPLIYGPGVKGNLASLIRLVRRIPVLPLGGISNRRSLLGVMNLASAIEAVIDSDSANGKTFLVSDGEEISTSELVKRLAVAYNPGCRIISLPAWIWKLGARVPGLAGKFLRLCGSLPVDSGLITREIGWKPPYTMSEQLKTGGLQ